jgi:excisionase family DNA binding protein
MQKRIPIHRELPDLVTVPEAAKFLGVGRKVVYQLLEHDVLRAIRQQSKIFIAPCCLYDFQSKGTMA